MEKNISSLSNENRRTWSSNKDIPSGIIKSATLTKQSAILGGIIGEIGGAFLGTVTGSLTKNATGTLMGFTMGVILGALTGILIGMLVSKTAGSSGGPSIGAYSGMAAGAVLGAVVGLIIPDSLRTSSIILHAPVLDTLASSRFETVAFFAFVLCVLGTAVGVWVSGINYKPEK